MVASHSIGEPQVRSASQSPRETQRKAASQVVGETHVESASQVANETHIGGASQKAHETHKTSASLDYEEEKRRRGEAWKRRQREFFQRLKHPRLRILVEGYYDMQKLRISLENRLRIYSRFDLLTPAQVGRLQGVVSEIRRQEKVYERMVADEVKDIPIYTAWLKKIKGVGPMMAAGLIAWVDDPGRFANVSKLWAYAVGKPGERRSRGAKIGYHPRLKTHCWKIATQMLKAKGEYAELYYRFKQTYSQREDLKQIKKGSFKLHVHYMAVRKMVKIFLEHFWRRWRELEGLPVTKPYVIEKLGHTSYVEPPELGGNQ